MKKCLAMLLSALLLWSTVPMVAASYNDDEFNWGDLTCTHSRLIEKAEVPSTCTVAGTAAYYVCADCHVLVGTKESLPLADHSYDNGYDTTCNACGAQRDVQPIPGDVNGDCSVDNQDLARLQQYLNDWGVTIYADTADVNNDGRINNRDLGLLMQYLNNWNVELI